MVLKGLTNKFFQDRQKGDRDFDYFARFYLTIQGEGEVGEMDFQSYDGICPFWKTNLLNFEICGLALPKPTL